MMHLPCDLPSVPAANVADPDGEIERAAWCRLRADDSVGAAQLVLTIESPIRRAVWLQNFRPTTIAAARRNAIAE